MQTKIYNQKGEEAGAIDLAESIFGLPLNLDLLQQARVAIMANKRKSIAHSKDRSEVRGGGKKPWRQKGTGRARHGSRRSPIWKGGGVSHGPRKEKDFSKKISVGMARKALKTALSSKFNSGDIRIVSDFEGATGKTKDFLNTLKNVFGREQARSILLVLPKTDKNIFAASGNIPNIKVEVAGNLNLMDVLKYKKILFTEEAVHIIQK